VYVAARKKYVENAKIISSFLLIPGRSARFIKLVYVLLECRRWSAAPISVCLHRGPGGCFRSELCAGGEPMAAAPMNPS